MEPSISDGHCKLTSFPSLSSRLKWFTAEIASAHASLRFLDAETCGYSQKGEVVRCFDSSITSPSEAIVLKQFSEKSIL